jgi:outer membrane protein assembly factor BamD (BamD/ComL family)
MRFESSNVQLAAAEKLQAEAKAAYKKGNYKAAISKFTEVINNMPNILLSS